MMTGVLGYFWAKLYIMRRKQLRLSSADRVLRTLRQSTIVICGSVISPAARLCLNEGMGGAEARIVYREREAKVNGQRDDNY